MEKCAINIFLPMSMLYLSKVVKNVLLIMIKCLKKGNWLKGNRFGNSDDRKANKRGRTCRACKTKLL